MFTNMAEIPYVHVGFFEVHVHTYAHMHKSIKGQKVIHELLHRLWKMSSDT